MLGFPSASSHNTRHGRLGRPFSLWGCGPTRRFYPAPKSQGGREPGFSDRARCHPTLARAKIDKWGRRIDLAQSQTENLHRFALPYFCRGTIPLRKAIRELRGACALPCFGWQNSTAVIQFSGFKLPLAEKNTRDERKTVDRPF